MTQENKTGVNDGAGSPPANPNPAGQKEMENQIRENLRAEYDRKAQEASEKLEAVTAEKAELESRVNQLSKAEQDRLDNLNDDKKIAESQLRELETKPEFAGYREKISRDTSKMKIEAVSESTHETSKLLMNEFIERKAEECKIPVEQLKKELNDVLKVKGTDRIRYPDLLPHDRAKAAFADRAERIRIQTLEDENKRLKAERDGFSEEGSRVPRETRTTEQLRDAAVSGDTKSAMALSSELDRRQREFDSQKN